MKIYTRTGDQGTTSLFSGQRVNKNDPFIEALGSVDESNSSIGMAVALLPWEDQFSETRLRLENIQHTLFDIGAALATPRSCGQEKKLHKTRFDQEAIDQLEQWIDQTEAKVPPLTHFILPGGHPVGAALHVARSTVRRAECLALPLYQKEEITNDVLIYLNRLSDYLFVLSRHINHLLNSPETTWAPHKVSTKP
ncbi:MAG: cob(I)yrinic acid a,c-diamide adenosyltransferase [Parachlamydia sp.]|jgi:cob(I)alamin adenosyltransferase|nr:cob(I)yrinic acid a,c-diamide adenosyltransferase [Parachlamydia sp.]